MWKTRPVCWAAACMRTRRTPSANAAAPAIRPIMVSPAELESSYRLLVAEKHLKSHLKGRGDGASLGPGVGSEAGLSAPASRSRPISDRRMRRRKLLALLGGAAIALPGMARAQPTGRTYR